MFALVICEANLKSGVQEHNLTILESINVLDAYILKQ